MPGRTKPQTEKRWFGAQAMRYVGMTLVIAAVLSTIFTSLEPANLNPDELAARLLVAAGIATPQAQSNPLPENEAQVLRVGIVSGHAGIHPDTGIPDPGAVCADGLTEAEVNLAVAELVVTGLQAAGLETDLLLEFDERLAGYEAVALISIHADSCMYIGPEASGFKVATVSDTAVPDRAQRLETCLINRYEQATDLAFHPGSITRDMSEYHTFNEIDSHTPAAIIEIGFLYMDRLFLLENPHLVASGIINGVLCYINNEPVTLSGDQ